MEGTQRQMSSMKISCKSWRGWGSREGGRRWIIYLWRKLKKNVRKQSQATPSNIIAIIFRGCCISSMNIQTQLIWGVCEKNPLCQDSMFKVLCVCMCVCCRSQNKVLVTSVPIELLLCKRHFGTWKCSRDGDSKSFPLMAPCGSLSRAPHRL